MVEVEDLDIQSKKDQLSSKEVSDLYKDKGNGFFKKADYQTALKYYSLAVEYNDKNDKALLNRAFCYLKLDDWNKSVEDCSLVLAVTPKNAKALYRRSQGYMAMNRLEEAFKDLSLATILEPTDKNIKVELSRCLAMIKPLDGIPLTARWRRIPVFQYSSDLNKKAQNCSHSRKIKFIDDVEKKDLIKEKLFLKDDPPSNINDNKKNKKNKNKPIKSILSIVNKDNKMDIIEDDKSINQEKKIEKENKNKNDLIYVSNNSDDDNSGSITPINNEDKKKKNIDFNKLNELLIKNELLDIPKDIPKTYFQFKSDWSSLSINKDKEDKEDIDITLELYKKYSYFNKINPIDLSKIIGTGLETDILIDLSNIFEYIIIPKLKDSNMDMDSINHIILILDNLRKIERFKLCYMFIDNNNKIGFINIINLLKSLNITDLSNSIINSYI